MVPQIGQHISTLAKKHRKKPTSHELQPYFLCSFMDMRSGLGTVLETIRKHGSGSLK